MYLRGPCTTLQQRHAARPGPHPASGLAARRCGPRGHLSPSLGRSCIRQNRRPAGGQPRARAHFFSAAACIAAMAASDALTDSRAFMRSWKAHHSIASMAQHSIRDTASIELSH
jgi:hypothetical protein